ncbi:MAG: hypothetical protein LBB67_06005 [Oscillospiraceae bacterium]|jgi:fructose-specific phosphotransferase system IIC component|nr:hypothetical protein [Oscillospiraceae bacterium]
MQTQLKSIIRDTRTQIYRTTSILFLVQLFGALGAGFFFVVQNILGTQHMLGAIEPINERILWFILFWGTDFFMIALCAVLCYLIAGLPGLAPGLALSVYFAHFSGSAIEGPNTYFSFFATPLNNGGGVNIGYMGYFVMALFCALLIKLLYAGWDGLKQKIAAGLNNLLEKLRGKTEKIPGDLTGMQLIEAVDLIVLVLIIPVASAALTFVLVRYGIQKPFAALAEAITEPLTRLSSQSMILTGVLFGLMIGFDIIGPISMAAFAVSAAAFFAGDAQLLTIYGACFVTIGWSPLFFVLLAKIKKKVDTCADDMSIASSGPINAFFENIKLTVNFSMSYAMRSPFAVIPGLMAGSAVTGLLTALTGIVNDSYLSTDTPPKYGMGKSMTELLQRGEVYLSFTLPLRSGDWLRCRIPLFLIILAGAAVGGLVIYSLRCAQTEKQKKRGTYVAPAGDIVLEMRQLAKSRFARSLTD